MAAVDPGVWAAVIGLGISIIGGAITMAWKLGGLNGSVTGMGEQLKANTGRLDVIEAKADGAKEAATAATAAATAIASMAQRRASDFPPPAHDR